MAHPICYVSDCSMRATYTATPMTGTLDGNWEDHGGRPVPACRSHLTSVLTWMGEHESDFHVSTNLDTPAGGE